MRIESLKPEERKTRKNMAVVDENAPLIPKTQEETDDRLDDFNGASFSGAVFNLSTTIIGAGIMGLPACVKKLGMVPGLLAIVLTAILTEKSIEFMIRFSRAGNLTSYGSLMGDAFGKYGKALVEICVVINNIGVLIVYMIIIGEDHTLRPITSKFIWLGLNCYHQICSKNNFCLTQFCFVHIVGDVISGTSSNGIHHPGVLEGWFGVHWWTGRTFVLVLLSHVVFAPLVSFKRIGGFYFLELIDVKNRNILLVVSLIKLQITSHKLDDNFRKIILTLA